jgi:hypothetical protein
VERGEQEAIKYMPPLVLSGSRIEPYYPANLSCHLTAKLDLSLERFSGFDPWDVGLYQPLPTEVTDRLQEMQHIEIDERAVLKEYRRAGTEIGFDVSDATEQLNQESAPR